MNYAVCYYLLLQCLFETMEESLKELLERMSPEYSEDGIPSDEKIYKKWKDVIDYKTMNADEIRKAIKRKLEFTYHKAEKTIEFLEDADLSYYLDEAILRAEALFSEN